MDLFEEQRNYKEIHGNKKVLGYIDRTFSDDIAVKLPCGYMQRFWHDLTDSEALRRCIKMKSLGIESI